MAILIRFIIFALVIFFIARRLSQFFATPKSSGSSRSTSDGPNKDPYVVLGVAPGASQATIKAAYRRGLSEYHPDKVMHLGEDIQKLAMERTNEIIEAYDSLSK